MSLSPTKPSEHQSSGRFPVYLAGPCFGDTTPSEAPSTPIAPGPQSDRGIDLAGVAYDKGTTSEGFALQAAEETGPSLLIQFEDGEHTGMITHSPPHRANNAYKDLLDIEFEDPTTNYQLLSEHLPTRGSPAIYLHDDPQDGASAVAHANTITDDYGNEEHEQDGDEDNHEDAWDPEQRKDTTSCPPSSSPPRFSSSPPVASSQTSAGDCDLKCEEDQQIPFLSLQSDSENQMTRTGDSNQFTEYSAPGYDEVNISETDGRDGSNFLAVQQESDSVFVEREGSPDLLRGFEHEEPFLHSTPLCEGSELQGIDVEDICYLDDDRLAEQECQLQTHWPENGDVVESTTTLPLLTDIEIDTVFHQADGARPEENPIAQEGSDGRTDGELGDLEVDQQDIQQNAVAGIETQNSGPGLLEVMEPVIKTIPQRMIALQDDSAQSSDNFRDHGLMQRPRLIGEMFSERSTDEDLKHLDEAGDQEQDPELEDIRNNHDVRKPVHRRYTPLVPNPKRPTVAGQVLQYQKLSKPFRCPTVCKINSNSRASTEALPLLPPRPSQHKGSLPEKQDKGEMDLLTELPEDIKIKYRTNRAAAQFKSPLTVIPSGQQALIRPTPTIQALERELQTLKRALRVVRENEEETLEKITAKWTDAGREVAYELWTLVRDSAAGGDGKWAKSGAPDLKRKLGESWGWDDGSERKKALSGDGSSWGWDPLPEGDAKHADEEQNALKEYESGEEGKETAHGTIGTMLMQLGIWPATLGWDEDEECFVD